MLSNIAMKAAKAGKNKNLVRSAGTFSGQLSYSSPESDFYNSFVRSEVRSNVASWSRSFSFASPEADFMAARRELHVDNSAAEAEWSGNLSFASPESDFTYKPDGTQTTWTPSVPAQSSTIHEESEWSGKLSFSSPEADCTADPHAVDWEWSSTLSFTSPEADFTANPEAALEAEWSSNLSFTSPEADFTADPEAAAHESSEWSSQLSFASPEADFTAQPETSHNWEWSSSMSFASPEADFTAHPEKVYQTEWSSHLSFASPESDFSMLQISSPESAYGTIHAHEMLNTKSEVLPKTVHEALADTTRAIVITQAYDPFRIVDVNDVWVGLCGFSKEEARHASLQLIQGPETNKVALTDMVKELMKGNEASALVTNYDKKGRKFHNQLKAGPIRDEKDQITHFVGILREVAENPEAINMTA